MLRKKQKRNLIIFISIIIVLLIAAAYTAVYLTTDMLKSDKTLFLKYLGKNTENIETIIEMLEDGGAGSKYEQNAEIKMNLTQKTGTTSENASNVINNLRMLVEGKTNQEENYNYRKIKLQNENQDVMNLEYLQEGDNYAIKFADIFKQYLAVTNGDIKEILSQAGVSEENLGKIPDTLLTKNISVMEDMKLSEEEIQTLKDKYVKIVSDSITSENFNKQKNQTITIDEKSVYVNVYTLTISKEELNKIYINVLEALKQEPIILEKISYIQEFIDKGNLLFDEPLDIENNFIAKIDETISDINKNNIGNEQTKISVYENAKQVVKTILQGVDYQIDLDVLKSDEDFAQLSIAENGEIAQKITIRNNQEKLAINIENNKERKPYTIDIQSNKQENTNGYIKNTNVVYKIEDNKIELEINNEIKQLAYVEKKNTLSKDTIQLDELEEEQLQNVLTLVKEQLNSRLEEIKENISMDDLQEVRGMLGMAKDTSRLSSGEEITETEKNRFNSKFQFLNTEEELDSIKMLDAIKIFEENISNLEVPSNTEIKVAIDRNQKNEDYVANLKKFIEKNQGRIYTIELEYDETTGLINYVIIKIVTNR